IDEKIEPSENKVNLIDPTFMQFNRGRNMEWVRAILRKIDLDIGNRLFEECTLEGIRVCRRNRFNVMVTDDPELRGMFSGKLDIEDMALPQGYADTLEWLKILSEKCGSGSFGEAKSCIEKEYRDAVSKYSGYLGGKRIAFAVSSFFNIDWMIECLSDAGAEICGVYTFRMGRSGKRFATRYRDRIRTAEGMAVNDIASLIKESKPELVIGNSYIARAAGCRFAPNPAESYTHYASVSYLEFITNILRVPESPGWEKWRLPQ
ncbi:MAG: hypothetical protein J5494_09220, partial [Candidatus Methanomethylophilaceae archaeon]|nr:hypothetical protein [Candidatus Methanomethylophilaceae archaeon]